MQRALTGRNIQTCFFRDIQLICPAIIQLCNDTDEIKVIISDGIWASKVDDQYAVYTGDMMTVISCSFKVDKMLG